jgi:hypothetical protein
MVTRILLAAILCLMPAYAAAQADTGPGRDIAAVHHLIEQYAKAVDTVDLKLLSQIWSHSPEVSFIHPLGEEHGFDAIEQQVFRNLMGGMFSARDLENARSSRSREWKRGVVRIPLDFSRDDAERRIGRDHAWNRNPGLPQRIWEVAAGARPLLRRSPVRPLSTCLRVDALPWTSWRPCIGLLSECQGASYEPGVSSTAVSYNALLG